MKRIRIRHSNDVDLGMTFSASLRGGIRGYDDAMALETCSNDFFPTIKFLSGFTVIVEVEDGNDRCNDNGHEGS